MATTTKLSPLRGLLAKTRLSRDQLAATLEVPSATVAGWEKALADVSANQLRDLAVGLDWPLSLLTDGVDEESAEEGELYGSLKLRLSKRRLEYPISIATCERVLNRVQGFDIQGGPR